MTDNIKKITLSEHELKATIEAVQACCDAYSGSVPAFENALAGLKREDKQRPYRSRNPKQCFCVTEPNPIPGTLFGCGDCNGTGIFTKDRR